MVALLPVESTAHWGALVVILQESYRTAFNLQLPHRSLGPWLTDPGLGFSYGKGTGEN